MNKVRMYMFGELFTRGKVRKLFKYLGQDIFVDEMHLVMFGRNSLLCLVVSLQASIQPPLVDIRSHCAGSKICCELVPFYGITSKKIIFGLMLFVLLFIFFFRICI